ncbi:MAG: Histidine triad nucleotide-binding protein 2, mitochondrial [Icmadophila ericetorum]|nr:Histidine triad nucleotide-binding protein 2, mitochondrial [Icmadophila ericetorum]
MPLFPSHSSDCPFCKIASAHPPSNPAKPTTLSAPPEPHSTLSGTPTYILLSTPRVMAFLDHAPISRGHVLVATRQHREKLSDISIEEGAAVGRWLGIVCRAVAGVALGLECAEEGDWNVVQNNGGRAAQVVPHVHFHIIPRSGDVPEIKNRSWTIFGRGQREELEEEDAVVLIQQMRERLEKEIEDVKNREGEAVWKILIGSDEPDTSRGKSKL